MNQVACSNARDTCDTCATCATVGLEYAQEKGKSEKNSQVNKHLQQMFCDFSYLPFSELGRV